MIFCLYIHLKLASKLISPHKGHQEDLSAAMIILNFYNDLDNVFAMPSSFFLGTGGSLWGASGVGRFCRGGMMLGNGDFVVTADLDGVSWSGPVGGCGRMYMSNLLAAFLLCARWGCNGPLGFHVSQWRSPKGD